MDFKLQNLSASENVFTYLMLLYDPNLGFDIRINRDSPLLENHVFQHLIQNPGTFTSTETDDGQISFSNLSDSDIWNDITEMKDGDVQIAVKDLRREILADYAAFSSDGQ